MQNHWNYGTDVNLTIRKPRKHVHKFNQKNNAHYKAACVDASFIKQIHRQRVCALIGTVSMSLRAFGHPKLTTERRTHSTTLTAGKPGFLMRCSMCELEVTDYESFARSLCSTHLTRNWYATGEPIACNGVNGNPSLHMIEPTMKMKYIHIYI